MVCLAITTGAETPVWSIIELQGDVVLPEDWQDQDYVELGILSLSPQVQAPCNPIRYSRSTKSCGDLKGTLA